MKSAIAIVMMSAGAALAQGDDASMRDLAAKAGIGGIGLSACSDVTGAENAPLLAQAGDWLLGYMAGRIDAGEMLVEDEPLSAASSIDIVTSIATFCAENPDATVLAAARRYGGRVFGTEPVRRAFEIAPSVVKRPESRPETDDTAEADVDEQASGDLPD
ncbi:hypothetical protein ILP92_08600 [Maribius pontilimi]|uniref:Uncharacterized protein n=1 Tax=Palleronia pontilimi TaxID=1964209 RepID=A0A934I9C9_9RHOB|nr:hypothetical protein [Palleronia pontilimi]MBJ3762803.1 hypothetical protein [Palleronia pontilimi]